VDVNASTRHAATSFLRCCAGDNPQPHPPARILRTDSRKPAALRTGGLAHAKANGSGLTVDEVVSSAVSGAATGRFTTPEEVADLVIFLASDRSANTTGADMRIDGGVVATL
jgi:NAD(P)-dependent dehydrogenase (short-subunit alcohol dehydrogenase family)